MGEPRHAPLNEVNALGPVTPDFIIRFEHLKNDLGKLEARFGLRLCNRLPVTEGAARTDGRPAAEMLSPEQKAIIRHGHARSFDVFGYEG